MLGVELLQDRGLYILEVGTQTTMDLFSFRLGTITTVEGENSGPVLTLSVSLPSGILFRTY